MFEDVGCRIRKHGSLPGQGGARCRPRSPLPRRRGTGRRGQRRSSPAAARRFSDATRSPPTRAGSSSGTPTPRPPGWSATRPSATHEYPSHRLAALSELIASMRGSAIACFGAMDLELRDERGERRRILQADQSVYLHPGRSRLPREAGMVIGEHDFPDVVVEVDHTTDVRRGKLWLYEEWGFPEVWVEVPERYAPSRPAGRLPGLVIHSPRGRALSHRAGQSRVSGVDGGGDPRRPERAGPLGRDRRGARPGGTGARRARGHRPRRPAVASRAPPGRVGQGTRRGAGRSAGRGHERGRGQDSGFAGDAGVRVTARCKGAGQGDRRGNRRRPAPVRVPRRISATGCVPCASKPPTAPLPAPDPPKRTPPRSGAGERWRSSSPATCCRR